MIEPDKMVGWLTRAMAFVIIVYVAVSIPSLLAFGQPGLTLLGDVDLGFLYAGSAGILVNICITLPICLNVLYSGMGLTWLPLMQAKTLTSISIRFMFLVLAFIVPMVFSKLSALIDLLSAVTLIATLITFPIWFYWVLLARKHGSFGGAVRVIGLTTFAWQCILLVLGCFALFAGVKGGIAELAGRSQCAR